MKKKHLEILLQKVPLFENSESSLEQYMTPAPIAADILFNAYLIGDIKGKNIIDLGCGTGIFAIGAAILGGKKIIGVDVDKDCISIARSYAEKTRLEVLFEVKNISDVREKFDTVFMNPPFGAQKSNLNADRRFIEKGFEISDVIYSLHLSKTVSFLEKMVASLGGVITFQKDYVFPIRRQFEFHKKDIMNFNVTLLRIKV